MGMSSACILIVLEIKYISDKRLQTKFRFETKVKAR